MLGTYSYHEIIKKTVVGFGTLFNNIELRRVVSGKTEVMKVPLAYGPRQKFLERLRSVGLNKTQTQITPYYNPFVCKIHKSLQEK